MDHETSLQSANQALGGRAERSTSRFASVELRGLEELDTAEKLGLPLQRESRVPNGAWEIAAMLSVGIATVLAVVGLWFL